MRIQGRISTKFFLFCTFCLAMSCESGVRFGLQEQSEEFSQSVAYNNKVDILFVVDNSTSMKDHQQELSRTVPDLINKLNSLKMNYQVAVTTTTMSPNATNFPMTRQIVGSPKFLNQRNINLLTSRLLVGDTGHDLEAAFDSVRWVLSDSYLSANAPGFLRPDALLALIFIGDEDDQSVGSTSNFESFLNQIKPPFKEGGRAWLANFIGVTSPSSLCDSLGAHVSVGLRYMDMVNKSGGVKESICDRNLSVAVANIKARIVEVITAYRLETEPNLSTVQVWLNGVPVSNDSADGWTYETQIEPSGKKAHLIRFHGRSVPPADGKVKVKYDPKTAG